MMSLEALILAAVLGTASSLNCQCSSEAGGIPCYNGWCHVQDSGGKVGACAFVRIGVRQHFACVRVKPTSKDSCRVSRRRNGEQQVQCWCRENYCNTDLADRIDEDHEEQENVAESAEKIPTRTTTMADAMNDEFIIERNYDLKDEDYLNENNDEETLRNNDEDHPPTLPPTRTTAGTAEQNSIMTAAIPPWRRDYPMDRNQIQFNWLVPPPLAPLPTKPDTHKVLLQLAAEHEQRIQQQYAQQRDHLRRTEYERKAQPITLSSSTRTTAITTTTTMTTTSAPPFVLSKEPPLANERSPHRHEDNAIVFDRRLYDEHEGRRRHEELLRKEQLMIVERARAQAAARSRLLKQNVTKPRAWLQVGLMDARAFDNRRAPPVLTVRNYRPFDLNSIPSDAAERSTTTETVIRHSTATSGTESQHDIQIDTVMNSSDADGEEENKKSATSITTTPRTTITLITAATETLPSSTLSDAMTKKISLNPTTSVALPTTTTTTTSTARTTSTVRTTSESPTTTTTTSTSTTTAITTIISKAHSNHQRLFIPAQNVTRAFRQKVTKSKLDDASIASSSTVFLAVIIAFVSFLS